MPGEARPAPPVVLDPARWAAWVRVVNRLRARALAAPAPPPPPAEPGDGNGDTRRRRPG